MVLVLVFFVAQLLFFFNVIRTNNITIKDGKQFRFLCRAYDPVHPFYGRYLQLNFNDTCVPGGTKGVFKNAETYVIFAEGKNGFAEAQYVSADEPENTESYIKIGARDARSVVNESTDSCHWVRYPFDRYYLAEEKAPKAEKMVMDALRDSTISVWVNVTVYKGRFMVNDVMMGKTSLKEALKQ